MLAVIDYGAGNLRSVLHSLKHLGLADMRLVRAGDELRGANKIILPGVGAFGASMAQLRAQGLVEALKLALADGVPYLGICVGMQALYEVGEEMGEHEGLGVLRGRVLRFPGDDGLKVPHMGWNQLRFHGDCALFSGLDARSYAYFVHSYFCAPIETDTIVASADYGVEFAAAVQKDNMYGVQFHPEKSQRVGLRILSNFLRI